ncbi:glycosyltransferase [uncultured Desulfosarcina sp.]|uniref:glycosyltransferase n=1 Tax=uncultured Desulfosarcina sp. TaxID=218289 RepID=UPI0029C6E9FE|nr:glycosyltransferase [uncultured Desulfosarcina sp.]
MNILYFSSVDISLPNGPGINEREFIFNFSQESKINVDNLSFLLPVTSQSIQGKLKNCYWYDLKKNRFNIFPFNIIKIYPLFILIRKLIKKKSIDFVIIRMNKSLIFIILYLALKKISYAIKTLGNEYCFDKKKLSYKQRSYLYIYRIVLKYILKNAKFIDVCTDQFKSLYSSKYSLPNIKVIENSVNTDKFYLLEKDVIKENLGLSQFDPIIGYCGGSPSKRGAKQIIEIFPKLKKEYNNIGILIIGEDQKLKSLKKMNINNEDERNVIFTGIINYEKINEYINCFDLGFALDTFDRIRTIGNSSQKIRQYISCGVPAICATGTNRKIIDAGFAYEVNPNDIDEIFETVNRLLKNKQSKCESYRKNAHNYACEYLSVKESLKERNKYWFKNLFEV